MLISASNDDVTWLYNLDAFNPQEELLPHLKLVQHNIAAEHDNSVQTRLHRQLLEVMETNFPQGAINSQADDIIAVINQIHEPSTVSKTELQETSQARNKRKLEELYDSAAEILKCPELQRHLAKMGSQTSDHVVAPRTSDSVLASQTPDHVVSSQISENVIAAQTPNVIVTPELQQHFASMSPQSFDGVVADSQTKTTNLTTTPVGPERISTSADHTNYAALFDSYRPKRPLDISNDPDLNALDRPEERIVISYTRMPAKIYLKHKARFFALFKESIHSGKKRTLPEWKRWAEHGFGCTFRKERVDRLLGMWQTMGLLDEWLYA